MIVTDQIARDEETHTYWQVPQYRRVVGFSELMTAMGYVDGKFAKEEHLRRGKNVHLAIHYHEKALIGEGGGVKTNDLAPHLRMFFESYLSVFKSVGARPLLTECFVFDPLVRLACQLDSLWAVGDELWLVEYKTGVVYDHVKYQTAAAVNGLAIDRPIRRFGLQLMADGTPGILMPFTDPDNLRKVRMFASTFYQWVEDGRYKPWPQTWDGLLKLRSENNGNESELFNYHDVTADTDASQLRHSEGASVEDQGIYSFGPSPI